VGAHYDSTSSTPAVAPGATDNACGVGPEGKCILDLMFNDQSSGIAGLMKERNSLYKPGFTLTENVHTCFSDYKPFWEHGFCAVMTHAEQHAPVALTPNDTVAYISTLYAKKNGELGLAILAELAGSEGLR
jgi:hypothetical protein